MDEEDLLATCHFAPAIPLYTSTAFAVHRSSFPIATNRNKGGTQRSRTANVSFLVLFLSMYCLLLTIRVFCFLKNVELICLQCYRPSQIERLDTICAKCNTSSGFSVIRFHHLKRSFSPVPEGHTETVAGVL